jgi:hypothetical protein
MEYKAGDTCSYVDSNSPTAKYRDTDTYRSTRSVCLPCFLVALLLSKCLSKCGRDSSKRDCRVVENNFKTWLYPRMRNTGLGISGKFSCSRRNISRHLASQRPRLLAPLFRLSSVMSQITSCTQPRLHFPHVISCQIYY